jgi:hypothetical protein
VQEPFLPPYSSSLLLGKAVAAGRVLAVLWRSDVCVLLCMIPLCCEGQSVGLTAEADLTFFLCGASRRVICALCVCR